MHTDRTKHHLCSVHRAGRSTPSPPSSVLSEVDAGTDVELVPLVPSQLPSWSARGRGNLRVNLSVVLNAETSSGRLSLSAVGMGTSWWARGPGTRRAREGVRETAVLVLPSEACEYADAAESARAPGGGRGSASRDGTRAK